MKLIITGLLLLLAGAKAKADMNVAEYESGLQTPHVARLVKLYVMGLGDGIVSANEIPGRAPFFCAPPNDPIGVEGFLNAINLQIEAYNSRMSQAEVGKLSLGLLLLQGLQEIFPCKGS
jgi:hypothetical protein